MNSEFFRARAEVDLSAICENLDNISSVLPSDMLKIAVVKADAYGHGAINVARAIYDSVFGFAVATYEEAMELRQGNISKPIFMLGFAHPDFFESIIENGLVPAVFSYEDALLYSEIASKMGKKVRINIKIDTGMGRIGFLPTRENAEVIYKISTLPFIETYGIFTHFSSADERDKSFTNLQSDIFVSYISSLEAMGVKFELAHASNSAASMEMPEVLPKSDSHKRAARIGIALYGLYPDVNFPKNIALKPAMSFKSHIVHIKELEAGASIGYGRSFSAIRKSRIATIPVGYADGYSRRLSSYGRVIIGGALAPVVGKICMDMCMVDITDIKDVELYDEVVLMGSDGEYSVTADDIARLTGTISYEVVCSIGKRVPREYLKK